MLLKVSINIFFNYSPKREGLLEHVVQKSEMSSEKKRNLIGLCKTRWSEHDKAFQYFHDAFPYVIEALEMVYILMLASTKVYIPQGGYSIKEGCLVVYQELLRFFVYCRISIFKNTATSFTRSNN